MQSRLRLLAEKMTARKGNDYDDRRRAANHACSSVVSWQIETRTNDRWRSVGGIVSKRRSLKSRRTNVAVEKKPSRWKSNVDLDTLEGRDERTRRAMTLGLPNLAWTRRLFARPRAEKAARPSLFPPAPPLALSLNNETSRERGQGGTLITSTRIDTSR